MGFVPESILFPSAAAWEAWLEENHASTDGIWIRMAKKASGIPSVSHPDALEIALCFGWIDGQRRALDDEHFLQRFTPRRRRSPWSKINAEKAQRLLAEGRMRPSGLAEIERAKADGRWDVAYASQRVIEVPDDLQAELAARPKAAEFFAELDSRNRYAILYRLQDAKRPETRVRRLEKFVAMLEAGEKIY
jgi:uncharacterized protein YdeI (YjbR/CyaY-like superfamily)